MLIFTLISVIYSQIAQLSLDGMGLNEALNQLIQDDQLDCQTIELVVARGFGQQILDLIGSDQIILEQHLQCAKSSVINDLAQLEQLKNKFTNYTNQVSITPIILWAQSKGNILIKVKFAHRIDAPAYISVKNHQISCHSNLLKVSAESDQNNVLTSFYLDVPLQEPVHSNVIWQVESVGTIVLNITKVEQKLWLNLSKRKNDKFQIWWDLRKQIGKDMDDFSKMLENQEEIKTRKKQQTIKKNESPKPIGIYQKFIKWLSSFFS